MHNFIAVWWGFMKNGCFLWIQCWLHCVLNTVHVLPVWHAYTHSHSSTRDAAWYWSWDNVMLPWYVLVLPPQHNTPKTPSGVLWESWQLYNVAWYKGVMSLHACTQSLQGDSYSYFLLVFNIIIYIISLIPHYYEFNTWLNVPVRMLKLNLIHLIMCIEHIYTVLLELY